MSPKVPAILGSIANKLVAEFCDSGVSKGKNTQSYVTLKI